MCFREHLVENANCVVSGKKKKHKHQSYTGMGLKFNSEVCWLCDLDELLNHSEPLFPNL